jgi:hypothetical protein
MINKAGLQTKFNSNQIMVEELIETKKMILLHYACLLCLLAGRTTKVRF